MVTLIVTRDNPVDVLGHCLVAIDPENPLSA